MSYQPRGRGCLVTAIAVLLMLAFVTAALVVVFNLTPNQIGLANVPVIDHKSAADLSMADSKIKELIQLILQMLGSRG